MSTFLPVLGAGAATEDGVLVSLLAATRRHLQSWRLNSSSSEEMCCATDMGEYMLGLCMKNVTSNLLRL